MNEKDNYRRKNIMKKILVTLFLFALAIPQLPNITAKANSADTAYSFNLYAGNPSYSLSEFRRKDDDTSLYINPRTMTGTLTKVCVRAYGSDYENGSGYTNCTWYNRGYYYTSGKLGGMYEVYNSVYKRDKTRYEALGIATGGGTGLTGGNWSPDTVGDFGQLTY